MGDLAATRLMLMLIAWEGLRSKMLRTDETVAELRADLLSASRMYPGADYKTVLEWVHETFHPRTYLEIGVSGGGSLARAKPDTLRVGVDPDESIAPITWPDVFIETMTSNEFFDSGRAYEYFRDQKLDFCFIDGSHLMEQVVEDFGNTLQHMAVGGVIALHDILPIRSEVASREKRTLMWTGDVWKAALVIHDVWPQLDTRIVKCIPSGLLVVRVDAPVEDVHRSRIEAAVDRHLPRKFDVQARAELGRFRILENSKPSIASYGSLALETRRAMTF